MSGSAIMMTLKRFGITTGATAAAASKASAIYLVRNEKPASVTIPTPIGLRLEIPVDKYAENGDERCASVRKFAGDNPDALDGIEVIACSGFADSNDVVIVPGEGVGVITRSGLMGRGVGEKAVSSTAMWMIVSAVKEVTKSGIYVRISVPMGEELAKRTMNPAVGIVGGISILGTTGIEYPVSDEDYVEHIKAEAEAVRSLGYDTLIIAPGNTSFEYASRMYGENVVKVGDRVGDAIRIAEELGFTRVIIVGMPGKITKLSAGMLNTHSKYGDARIESLTLAAVLAGIGLEKLRRVASSLTVSEALQYLTEEERVRVMGVVVERALERLRAFTKLRVGVVVLTNEGEVLVKGGDA